MRKWSEFGDMVNRLVYSLAGRKYHGDIEATNRYLAERIAYSEVSVRMMRQGRFRPREDRAIETLIEIGQTEAELGRDWAQRLLYSAHHPTPQSILTRLYPSESRPQPSYPPSIPSRLSGFVLRLVGGFAGMFITMMLWSYAISQAYPAPHELPVVLEVVWGLFIGSGMAAGFLFTDAIGERDMRTYFRRAWRQYLLLPAGGMLGGILWSGVIEFAFVAPIQADNVVSTWLETASYGAVYGLSFGLGTIFATRRGAHPLFGPRQLRLIFIFIFGVGGFALFGFLLAIIQPAFANQKEIDIFVGIMFRIGLLLTVAGFFHPIQKIELSGNQPIPAAD